MLSNSEIKKIRSLQLKKFRKEHQLFIVEGEKVVQELEESDYEIVETYRVGDNISEKELQRISAFKSPSGVLAVARIPQLNEDPSQSAILLDGVSDPGNLGTIVRIADWYGISQVVCSEDTVECYSPKVVQATMGSLFRIKVVYTDIAKYLTKSPLVSFAAVMDGEESFEKLASFNLILGSESHGIRNGLDQKASQRITIPRRGKSESLNVGVAAGILMDRLTKF